MAASPPSVMMASTVMPTIVMTMTVYEHEANCRARRSQVRDRQSRRRQANAERADCGEYYQKLPHRALLLFCELRGRAAEPTKLRRALSGEKKQPLGLPPNNSRQTCRLTARIDIMQALNAGRQDNGRPLRAVTAPLRQPQERHLGRDSPAGTVAAVVILATETRVFDGFAPFAKSANVRVSQGFEDMERTTPVSDNLKSALASLSRSMQSEQKPPVRATGE